MFVARVLGILGGTLAVASVEAEEPCRVFIERYDGDYRRVPFDPNRVRNLPHDPARPACEVGLKRIVTTEYGDLDVHHRIDLSVYTYSSEQDRMVALEAWLLRFSILGDPIVFGKRTEGVKSPPLFAVITATTIAVVATQCETADGEWERNINEARTTFGSGSYTTLRVGCGGPVEWEAFGGSAPN